MFDSNDMDLIGEMLRPVGDGPFTKTPDLKRTADVVALDCVACQEWVVGQFGKDSEQLLSLTFRDRCEHGENGVVHRVAVSRHHRPSADSLSCSCCSSAREWP